MDSGNEQDVKQQATRAANARLKEIQDLKVVLSTAQGRRFYWRLLSKCNIFAGGFDGDNDRLNFREGERNIGLFFLAEIMDEFPDFYLLAQKEELDRKTIQKHAREKQETDDDNTR